MSQPPSSTSSIPRHKDHDTIERILKEDGESKYDHEEFERIIYVHHRNKVGDAIDQRYPNQEISEQQREHHLKDFVVRVKEEWIEYRRRKTQNDTAGGPSGSAAAPATASSSGPQANFATRADSRGQEEAWYPTDDELIEIANEDSGPARKLLLSYLKEEGISTRLTVRVAGRGPRVGTHWWRLFLADAKLQGRSSADLKGGRGIACVDELLKQRWVEKWIVVNFKVAKKRTVYGINAFTHGKAEVKLRET
ncbi:MAG: hypothetical protein Q9162_006052 [Coniocarpon cinnabarinum]